MIARKNPYIQVTKPVCQQDLPLDISVRRTLHQLWKMWSYSSTHCTDGYLRVWEKAFRKEIMFGGSPNISRFCQL